MPKMSSTDATIHSALELIHALHNLEPGIPLVTLVNLHKESLKYLAEIFAKLTSSAVPPGVTIDGAYPDKLQQVNQEEKQNKNYFQIESPFIHAEPLIFPIDKAYPEKLQ